MRAMDARRNASGANKTFNRMEKKLFIEKTMSEVYARASPARHRQRSRHAHPHSC